MPISDTQRRDRASYINLKLIGEMLINDGYKTTAEQLDWFYDFMNARCFFGSQRAADAAADSLALVKKDLGLI